MQVVFPRNNSLQEVTDILSCRPKQSASFDNLVEDWGILALAVPQKNKKLL